MGKMGSLRDHGFIGGPEGPDRTLRGQGLQPATCWSRGGVVCVVSPVVRTMIQCVLETSLMSYLGEP